MLLVFYKAIFQLLLVNRVLGSCDSYSFPYDSLYTKYRSGLIFLDDLRSCNPSPLGNLPARPAGLVDIFGTCVLLLCLRHLEIKCSLFSSHKGGKKKKQIFVSAVAVSLAAEAAWHTECEQSTGQAEPITAALTTCPTPTARIKIPALRGQKKEKLTHTLAVMTVIFWLASSQNL